MSTGTEEMPTVNTHEYRGYRQIWLVNSNNTMFDLAGDPSTCKVFLNGPRGLGFDTELSMVRFGNANYTVTSVTKFPSISGTLIFHKDPYETYKEFMDFINVGGLKMYYQPYDHEYYMDVDITKVDKSELDRYGVLRCSITIAPLSFWKDRDFVITDRIVESRGSNNIIDISAINTDLDVGLYLTAQSLIPMVNPEISLIISNNDGSEQYEYGQTKFIGNYTSLELNTNDGEHSIAMRDTDNILIFGEKANARQDFSGMNGTKYITFIKVPKKFRGMNNIMLKFSFDAIVNLKCTPLLRSV